MPELKDSVLVTRSDILAWAGIGKDKFRQIVAAGLLEEVHLGKRRRGGGAYYRRNQVVQVFRGGEEDRDAESMD